MLTSLSVRMIADYARPCSLCCLLCRWRDRVLRGLAPHFPSMCQHLIKTFFLVSSAEDPPCSWTGKETRPVMCTQPCGLLFQGSPKLCPLILFRLPFSHLRQACKNLKLKKRIPVVNRMPCTLRVRNMWYVQDFYQAWPAGVMFSRWSRSPISSRGLSSHLCVLWPCFSPLLIGITGLPGWSC